MKYSFQVPIPLLRSVQGDIDFALAHFVLNDPDYRRFYRDQSEAGREVILDNGIHELGEPLPLDKIIEANQYIRATFIIPPDWHNDAHKTKQAFLAATDALPMNVVAPVVQGQDLDELLECYAYYVHFGVSMICLPYRKGQTRLDMIPGLSNNVRNHFLGVNYINEVEEIVKAPNPQLDTGKPFRYAQHGMHMFMLGKDPSPPAKLDMYRGCVMPMLHEQLRALYEAGGRVWQPS